MRPVKVTLTVERLLAADPQNRRRTAVALAATELVPAGVIVVDHGDAVSYLLGEWWVTVCLPVSTRDLIAGFYGGRATARPVTFELLVPEDADLAGTGTEEAAA
jgi:hypothetical protein